MDKKIPYCQSCGLPMSGDNLLGTNKGGGKSVEYCRYCYEEGAFLQEVTMEEMIEISLEHVKELAQDDPEFNEQDTLDYMSSFLPTLKRWSE